MAESGTAIFRTRSRIMLLLGEQLITDEVAALSELIKNAYDADATKVIIEIKQVSNQEFGQVTIKDNGNGMTKESLLKSWLELGTISKALKNKKRISEFKKRPYLGEKGLGRLAIHKIGQKTEITTRRKKTNEETQVLLDWSKFQDFEKFLEDIQIEWKTQSPKVFVGIDEVKKKIRETQSEEERMKADENEFFEWGTQITISNIHRKWTKEMIREIKEFVATMQSPFSNLEGFDVQVEVDDSNVDTRVKEIKMNDIFATANYTFSASITKMGTAVMNYSYNSENHPELKRSEKFKSDLKQYNIDYFKVRNKPECGAFSFKIYCWDLEPRERKTTFNEEITYNQSVKPFTGIKVFRDGFRVIPYGSTDNDWLNMDKARVGRFQENVSRNQVIGYIEINSTENPKLNDKSDREGLIDNDEYQDFYHLVICALRYFQTERNKERLIIKKELRADVRVKKLTEKFLELQQILKNEKISSETKTAIGDLILDVRETAENAIKDLEEPLLAAAALGLTYMIPTHEASREIHDARDNLEGIIKNKEKNLYAAINASIKQLYHADDMLQGIINISQATKDEERFWIKEPIEFVTEIMRRKAKRENIEIIYDLRIKKSVVGAQRLYSTLLLNLIDNSIYWLSTSRSRNKKIKVSAIDFDKKFDALVVSDNGPGLEDDLSFLTNPFVTRKTKGMGLGLYICERIAKAHKGKLETLEEFDRPGLLSGANILFLIPKEKS